MTAQSGNDLIEEGRDNGEMKDHPIIFKLWEASVRGWVEGAGADMDDQIFVLSDDGKEYTLIEPVNGNGAYDRAMKGI